MENKMGHLMKSNEVIRDLAARKAAFDAAKSEAPVAKKDLPKCVNVRSTAPAGTHYATCPQCGGYLAVLASGYFRQHKPVFAPGDPRIAATLYSQGEPKPYVASNGNRFTAEQAKLITEPLRYAPEAAKSC